MVSSRATGVVACLIAAVTTGPLLRNVPGATQQFAEASASAIAITDVTVIDVITGAHRTGLTVLIKSAGRAMVGESKLAMDDLVGDLDRP